MRTLLLALLLVAQAAGAQDLFAPIASVLEHPRCMNCHTVTDFPRQGDARARHQQDVVRGADGHGAETLHCAACHQDHNVADEHVPGAPGWHLAPLSMGWEGLSAGAICASIKDPARNGGRTTLAAVVEHMRSDPLVLWAWDPGPERTLPPLAHADFVAALDAWVAAGGPCPAP